MWRRVEKVRRRVFKEIVLDSTRLYCYSYCTANCFSFFFFMYASELGIRFGDKADLDSWATEDEVVAAVGIGMVEDLMG